MKHFLKTIKILILITSLTTSFVLVFSNNTKKQNQLALGITNAFCSPKTNLTKTQLASLQNSSSQEFYGRIFNSNTYFYSKPTDDISNAYFELETTYFVKLIADENTNFYKAQYLDLVGYVKKSDVKVTADTPKTPFLKDINFRVFAPISQTMRTHPSSSLGSASQVCYIPYLSKDALYYGKIVGESAIVDRTNIWYFCRYFSDKAYYGYIYSDGCDQMPEIKKNNEIVQYIEKPNFNNSSPTASLAVVQSFDTNYVPIIALVSVPVLIFVIMLVFGKFILKSKKKEAKEIKFFFDSH